MAFGKLNGNNIEILSEQKGAELSGIYLSNNGASAILTWNEAVQAVKNHEKPD